MHTVSVTQVSRNRWIEWTQQIPDHSTWYVERFRSMATAGTRFTPTTPYDSLIVPDGYLGEQPHLDRTSTARFSIRHHETLPEPTTARRNG